MALQSQMQRSSNSRVQWNPRRRRSRRNKLLVVGVIVVVIYLLWVFVFSGGDPVGDTQGPKNPGTGDGATSGATTATTGNDSISRASVGPVGSGNGSPASPATGNTGNSATSAKGTTTPISSSTTATPGAPGTPGNTVALNATGTQQPKNTTPATTGKAPEAPASAGTPTSTKPPEKGNVNTAPAVSTTTSTTSDPAARQKFVAGLDLQKQQKLLPARKELGEALKSGRLSEADAEAARTALGQINEVLVFSSQMDDTGQDALSKTYLIKPGDNLVVIAKQHKVSAEFLARINQGRIKSIASIRAGQQIKVVNGPFHLKVYKTRQPYRADLYLGDQYVRSFTVGLGKFNSTPVGSFIVKKGSKLTNPEWTDPATGQRMASNDPLNPLGERWIGLRGTDKETEPLTGYGIHGTIEPETVGKEGSRGCIRLLPKDVELLYDMLAEESSTVSIYP